MPGGIGWGEGNYGGMKSLISRSAECIGRTERKVAFNVRICWEPKVYARERGNEPTSEV